MACSSKASAHLTGGEIEAQKVAGPCPGFTVQTGAESWRKLGRQEALAPCSFSKGLAGVAGKRSVKWPGFPIAHCQGQAVLGAPMGQKGVCPSESLPPHTRANPWPQ